MVCDHGFFYYSSNPTIKSIDTLKNFDIEENRNVKIDKNENYTHHYVDEAKIQEINAKKEEQQQKRKINLILLICWIASLVVFLIPCLFTMDDVGFSPFQIFIIIDIIVGASIIRKRSKK